MDFNKIKQGFKMYLAEENAKKGKDIKEDLQLNDGASIFLNANEFRNYLSTEYNTDASIMTKSINDILKMDVENGKLVDPEEYEDALDFENGDFAPAEGENVEGDAVVADAPEGAEAAEGAEPVEGEEVAAPPAEVPEGDENAEAITMTDIINEFLADDDVKAAIDLDADGELSAEEIQNFLGAASALDGDDTNLSVEDLFTAAEIIKETNLKTPDKTNDEQVSSTEKADNETVVQDTTPSRPTGGSSGVSSGGYVGGSAGNYNSAASSTPTEKTLDKMSPEELQKTLVEKQGELSTKQAELEKATAGDTPELKEKQEAIDKSYEKYLEEVEKTDKDLAEELDAKKTQIDDKKQAISDKEAEISENECKVSDAETAVSNAKNTISSINNAISSVNSALSGDLTDKQKSDYNDKLNSLKSQLTEAENAKKKAETELENAKKALETSKEEKTTLEDELEQLNDEMQEIEDKILEANPKIEDYMKEYKAAQEDFDTAKADAISKAQEAVKVAQEAVVEVQNKLNEVLSKQIEASVGGEYNADAGAKLAKNALNVRGTTGWCLAGVSDTLAATYGVGLPGLGSAYKAADALRGNTPGYEEIASHFVEKNDYTVDDLPNLPAGAVIVWENGGSSSDGLSTQHGHISIALGDGRESSDHIQNQIRSGRNFTVFLPVS